MSPQNDIVRFQVNVPQSCKLKFASPRMCQTPYGERAMFSLHGGRIMFLEPKVAESIKMLELHPGEEFFIAKRNTKDRGEYWDVWLAPDVEKLRARKEAALGIVETPAPSQVILTNGSSTTLPSMPEHILDDAKAKLTAYHELCQWAKANLEGITRSEVRAILMNSMISAERKWR